MSTWEQRPVVIKSGEQEREGVLRLQVFSPQNRAMRAAKVWGLCWLLAAITLFIPIAHFVLVPGFLLAGPIWAFKRYGVTSALEQVTGHCPNNGEEITLKLDPSDHLPMWTYCPVCNASLQLLERPSAAVA